jgi:hypothetical protein
VIFWIYSLYIGNRLPYRESAGNALGLKKLKLKKYINILKLKNTYNLNQIYLYFFF